MQDNQNKPPSSRDALRRLLIVLTVVVGLTLYAYGWTVTKIDLEAPQEERRQTSVQNALRELLSPRIFTQEREVQEITANFRVVCDDQSIEQPDYDGPSMRISPDCGENGDEVFVEIFDFEPLGDTRIRWIPPEGQSRPRDVLEIDREEIVLDNDGNFSGTIEVPRISGTDEQIHQISVRVAIPTGPIKFSEISQQVLLRMVETVFMALLATSIAIPIAAAISFFAARNLMRPIRLSVGNMLTIFIAFFVGFALLGAIFSGIGALAFDIGSSGQLTDPDFIFSADDPFDVTPIISFVIPLLVIVGGIFAIRTISASNQLLDRKRTPTVQQQIIGSLNLLLIIVVVLFAIGTIGGWLVQVGGAIIDFGESLRPDEIDDLLAESSTEFTALPFHLWGGNAVSDVISAFGTVFDIIGTLIDLSMSLIAGAISGFAFASIVANLLVAPLRRIPTPIGHVLGGVLGFVSGGILMALMAQLGLSAALFGLFPPLTAALLGGQAGVLIFRTATSTRQIASYQTRNQMMMLLQYVIFAIGAVLAFTYTFNSLNVTRALVDGTLPPSTTGALGLIDYVADSAIIGAILGALVGALSGIQTNFPLGNTVYNLARTILNTIRSIEPLIMGLVFVVWVGIGPFAGVLALTLHSIASLGKLYSEQIENIDEGPIEAIRSTGAGWLQTVIYAVVPQIIPPYIAFTMYRWDINVRMSTIIGFVGGGGIGLLLNQQINLLRYRDAGVAVLAIAIVVSILDYASAVIRERLT